MLFNDVFISSLKTDAQKSEKNGLCILSYGNNYSI